MEQEVMEEMLYSFINAGNKIEQRFFTMYIFLWTETITLTIRHQQQTFRNINFFFGFALWLENIWYTIQHHSSCFFILTTTQQNMFYRFCLFFTATQGLWLFMCFCIAMQHLTKSELRQCIAWSLCDNWASCSNISVTETDFYFL